MAISPFELPKLRQEHNAAKSKTLIEKIDAAIVANPHPLPFYFPFHVNTPDELMNLVRDSYTEAGWDATIEWEQPKFLGSAGGDTFRPERQLKLDLAERFIEKIQEERNIAPVKVFATRDVMDIWDFANHIGINLMPWQKLLLKIIYAGTRFNEHIQFFPDDLKAIYRERFGPWDGLDQDTRFSLVNRILGHQAPPQEFIGVMGRRAGKTFLNYFFVLYEAYLLMSTPKSDQIYGLTPGSRVGVAHITYSEAMLNSISDNILRNISVNTVFQDAKRSKNKLIISKDSVYNKSGFEIIIEVALPFQVASGYSLKSFCIDEPNCWNKKYQNIYSLLKPSVIQFAGDAKIMVLGTVSREQAQKGNWLSDHIRESAGDRKVISGRYPTWVMNNQVQHDFLLQEHTKHPDDFMYQYGGEY